MYCALCVEVLGQVSNLHPFNLQDVRPISNNVLLQLHGSGKCGAGHFMWWVSLMNKLVLLLSIIVKWSPFVEHTNHVEMFVDALIILVCY